MSGAPSQLPHGDSLAGLEALEPALRRYLRKRAAAADVDDLVQEVFASLHARQKTTAILDVERYLFTVAAHCIQRRAAQARRWTSLDDQSDWQPLEEISAERILLGRERLSAAIVVISRLPPRTRQVFLLHRFEEMTYRRIGECLGISVSAVEKHMMIALRALIGAEERE